MAASLWLRRWCRSPVHLLGRHGVRGALGAAPQVAGWKFLHGTLELLTASLGTYAMAPLQKKTEKRSSKKKEMITVELKKEIIEKYERGMRVAEIARQYKKSTSTICSILKKKEEIRKLDLAKGVTRMSKQRPRVLEDVEKLLLVWINEKQLAGDMVTENLICEKAKALYTDLLSRLPATSSDNEEGFKASRGWLENFKRRSGVRSVVKHREAASLDAKAAEAFAAEFQKLVVSEGYLPEQVFSCDETGLFWKKMPKRTYIAEEEHAVTGHKAMKDRLTLLFCANARRGFQSQTIARASFPESASLREKPGAEEPVKCDVEVQQQGLGHSGLLRGVDQRGLRPGREEIPLRKASAAQSLAGVGQRSCPPSGP
ncbi:hypothetical protein JRQ81_012159 [Phrynocephalus forsythii]|uniref:HTH CENPB-type domain-containing protein n=1 Tax=Phrynocephalus forsythii TaxID=171643 RepID=A0A9Q1AQ97_9SAUR|nr:hypothetical protein JRQ81_012159 [Phrynocephalus forsythii]